MLTRDTLVRRDQEDPLAGFRDRFVLPEGLIYLDGNSLGAMPRDTPARVRDAVERQWAEDLIGGWNKHGWVDAPARVGDKIGRLVGAGAGQVVAADSTSVNLFKMLSAALDLRPDRKVILSDRGNFPTDLYMAQGLAALRAAGHELRLVEEHEVEAAIGPDVAVVMVTQVGYRTGRKHDMAAISRIAHAAGALTLWDLAHSAGAFPVHLDRDGADFAVGCGYKYLNGGPGAPAFLYVAKRHHDRVRPPLSGWFGHEAPFAFDLDYRPAGGIARNLCGTPQVLGLAALEAGIDLMLEADLEIVKGKSLDLTDAFADLVEQEMPGVFELVSPPEGAHRGSQVCLGHKEGYAIVQALIADRVVPDFRAPNVLRFGFAPLYIRHIDVWDAVARLKRIVTDRTWDREIYRRRAAVT